MLGLRIMVWRITESLVGERAFPGVRSGAGMRMQYKKRLQTRPCAQRTRAAEASSRSE